MSTFLCPTLCTICHAKGTEKHSDFQFCMNQEPAFSMQFFISQTNQYKTPVDCCFSSFVVMLWLILLAFLCLACCLLSPLSVMNFPLKLLDFIWPSIDKLLHLVRIFLLLYFFVLLILNDNNIMQLLANSQLHLYSQCTSIILLKQRLGKRLPQHCVMSWNYSSMCRSIFRFF